MPLFVKKLISSTISLSSEPKQPAFIIIPPPKLPGMPDKNSIPPIPSSRHFSEITLSEIPEPTLSFVSLIDSMPPKDCGIIIDRPGNPPSRIRVFDNFPKIFKLISL